VRDGGDVGLGSGLGVGFPRFPGVCSRRAKYFLRAVFFVDMGSLSWLRLVD